MALKRKALTAMGLTDEQVESIIEMHSETVNGLNEKLTAAEAEIEKLKDVQKELDALKAESGYKEKYENEHKAFEDFKKEVTAKETKTAKEAAVRAYFESKNITGANLAIAMRGAHDEINAVELDGEKIKDTSALDALISGDFSGLVVTQTTRGAATATPPQTSAGAKLTREEIYKKDEKGHYVLSTEERQKAHAENMNKN